MSTFADGLCTQYSARNILKNKETRSPGCVMTENPRSGVAALPEIDQVFDRFFEMGPLALATAGPDVRFQGVIQLFRELLGDPLPPTSETTSEKLLPGCR